MIIVFVGGELFTGNCLIVMDVVGKKVTWFECIRNLIVVYFSNLIGALIGGRLCDLFGRKKFDAIVTDAPYGVAHGATTDVRGTSGRRDRSPAGLLGEAIPVWASQLMHGGAIGIAWNTFGLTREDLAAKLTDAGLVVQTGGAWESFAHRVDSSIRRDLIVAVNP